MWHWPLSEEFPAADGANVAGNKNVTQSMCLLPDAAFLAREKARADAECYTAMKVAEANKVLCFPLWCLRAGPRASGCREILSTRAGSDPCLSQKAQQGHLLSAKLSSD